MPLSTKWPKSKFQTFKIFNKKTKWPITPIVELVQDFYLNNIPVKFEKDRKKTEMCITFTKLGDARMPGRPDGRPDARSGDDNTPKPLGCGVKIHHRLLLWIC